MQFWPILVLGLLSCIVHASPLTITEEKRDDLSYEEMFKQAEHFFPGVWWKSARDTCSEKQFKAIYEATSGAIGLLNGLEEKSYGDDDLGLSPAWYHFFMDGKIWQAQYPEVFSSMLGIYNQTRFFIQNGRAEKKSKAKRQLRVAYVCGDEPLYSTCRNKPKTQAYVPKLPTRLEGCTDCFTVSFCPGFFNLDPVVDVVKGRHWKKEDLSDQKLISREHAVFHEWMHVDLIGQYWHMVDLKDRDIRGDGYKHDVYGATFCADYAWKYGDERKVNYEIRLNGEFQSHSIHYIGRQAHNWLMQCDSAIVIIADNYAWVLSYAYYSACFGWGLSDN